MIVTSSMVPWIVGVACAIFAFGYGIGHALGRRDGEESVHEYYEGKGLEE